MAHYAINEPSEKICNALLENSIRIYQEIETIYLSMQNDLSATSVLETMQTIGKVNTLQQNVQTVDNHITKSLKTVSILSESTDVLLNEREEILKKLFQNNQNIANRAENVRSLLRHEITSISISHKAIKGYKPAEEGSKYKIKNSF